MGMDLVGRNPKNETGKYFRANCWSWRPIHDLIYELCGDVISAKTMHAMGFNDGAGPKTQKTCSTMAVRFDTWLENNIDGWSIDVGCHVHEGTGRFASDEEMEDPEIKTISAYQVTDEHLKEFSQFLHNCGGFEVW